VCLPNLAEWTGDPLGPDYFCTRPIILLAGRAFEDRDDEAAAQGVVVSHTLAQRFWGGAVPMR
jgi:hypothetical protein